MSAENVSAFFASAGLETRVMTFETSSATVELAAAAVGCEPERIAKTLSFLIDGKPTLIVLAGDARVDNRAFKRQFGTKPRMIPGEDVERLVGHRIGGVCPFAVNEGVDVYLDRSLARFNEVFPAAGSANSSVRLSLAELEELSGSIGWVEVGQLS